MRNIKEYKKDKLFRFLIIYGILYVCGFFLLESREVPIHLISSKIDYEIPFCEYFIIPYYFWFVYIAFTVVYFVYFCQKQTERKKFVFSFCAGMTVFLMVSYFYPNGHNLRPELTEGGFFMQAVRLLYWMDTPTNILPSMHVFVTVVCSVALLRQQELCKRKGFKASIWINAILIVLSTMFLKQHSVVDVVCALILNVICYIAVYKFSYSLSWRKAGYLRKRILHN